LPKLEKLRQWFYLTPGLIKPVRRLTGLCSLIALVLVGYWTWCYGNGLAIPYCVPAWRFQDRLLIVPMPPQWLFLVIFAVAGLSCLRLMFGSRNNLFVCLVLIALGYFGSRELSGVTRSWVIVDFCYLLALLFDRSGPSCARRLIQISVFFCYFYSAVQKLFFADFVNGSSLAAYLEGGEMVRPFFLPFLQSFKLPLAVWEAVSWLTIAFELYLAVALFLKTQRKAALVLGTIFHVTIVIFLNIMTFSLVMLTGYLAFIDSPKDEPVAQDIVASIKPGEFAMCLLLVLVMALIPARVYAWTGRPPNTIVQLDRAPWVFGMFVIRTDTKAVEIRYKDASGDWHEIQPVGRMKEASSDNELYALRNYVLAVYPDSREVYARLELKVNQRFSVVKTIHTIAGGTTSLTVQSLP
jgi:uncharacterized membrane protein